MKKSGYLKERAKDRKLLKRAREKPVTGSKQASLKRFKNLRQSGRRTVTTVQENLGGGKDLSPNKNKEIRVRRRPKQ